MNCKQADSANAILKLLLVQASMGQLYLITKQTYVVITRSFEFVGPVQTFCETLRILLRFCADICPKIGFWDLWSFLQLCTELFSFSRFDIEFHFSEVGKVCMAK